MSAVCLSCRGHDEVETSIMSNQITHLIDEARDLNSLLSSLDGVGCRDAVVPILDSFLGDASKGGEVSLEALKPVFESRFDFNERSLSRIREDAIPLALIRELVARHKIIITKKKYRNWSAFVQRYKHAVYA
jgi:hypothetical protein